MKIIDQFIHHRYSKLVLLDHVYNGNKPADVLILGDSVMERVAREDTDRRSLGQMIGDGLKPDHSSLVLSGTGYHPWVYYDLLLALSWMRHRPKVVVYPINLRCFSPQWDLNPAWWYNDVHQIIVHYYWSGSVGRVLTRKPSRDALVTFRGTRVVYPTSILKTVGEFLDAIAKKPTSAEEARLRKETIFTFHYMYPIENRSDKVLAIKASLRLAREFGMNVLAYITPINFIAGKNFAGPAFRSQIASNIGILSEAIKPHSGIDWSRIFGPGLFFSEDLATEHINQDGRQELSSRIIQEIKNIR